MSRGTAGACPAVVPGNCAQARQLCTFPLNNKRPSAVCLVMCCCSQGSGLAPAVLQGQG